VLIELEMLILQMSRRDHSLSLEVSDLLENDVRGASQQENLAPEYFASAWWKVFALGGGAVKTKKALVLARWML